MLRSWLQNSPQKLDRDSERAVQDRRCSVRRSSTGRSARVGGSWSAVLDRHRKQQRMRGSEHDPS